MGNGQPQPGEARSFVFALNDSGTALVRSRGASFFDVTYVLYKHGQTTVLDFGPTVTRPQFRSFISVGRFINNNGIIAGFTPGPTGDIFDGALGFRFDPALARRRCWIPCRRILSPGAWALTPAGMCSATRSS